MQAPRQLSSAVGLSGVPSVRAVPQLAAGLRDAWGLRPDDLLELRDPLASVGAELALQDLGGADGGPQGLLIPRTEGDFVIEVDPSPPEGWRDAPIELQDEISRHRMRFTVMHELAHTLFYRRDAC